MPSLQTGETLDCSMNAQLVSDDSMCASTTLPGSMNRNNSGLHVQYFMSEEEALRVDVNEHDDVLQLADSQIEEGNYLLFFCLLSSFLEEEIIYFSLLMVNLHTTRI